MTAPDQPTISTISRELAAFVVATKLRDVPEAVLERLRDDVVDLTGCVLWGHESSYGQAIVEHVAATGCGGVTVWGSDARASAGEAALAMGTLGHAFDFDDYHGGAKLHPATVVLPAVFALGEHLGSSGEQVLRAAVLGFEAVIRTALGCGPVATMLNGFHLTGICGGVGAAAGAAVLLGLGEEETAHALGLGATQGAGLMGFLHDGSESKRLHAGHAAQAGILAAQLAARGFTGPPRAFELEHGGFCAAFSTDPHPQRILEGLGARWTAGEVSFKRWSCCGSIHSTLDLVEQAMAELGVGPSELDAIDVRHSPAVVQQCGWPYEPSDALHAQMSLRYCVGALLADGVVLPPQFQQERLADPAILRYAARVTVAEDAEVGALYPEKFASRVIVRAGRQQVDLRTEHPKGAPEHPLSTEEVDAKFSVLAAPRLGEARCAEVAQLARSLEDLDDVGRFTRLLAAEGAVDI